MRSEEIYFLNQNAENEKLIGFEMCGITYPDNNYEINRVNSLVACIEYVEEGCGTINLDGKIFYPQEGDSYFLHQGMHQHYYSDKEKPWKKYFINVYGRLLESLIEGYGLDGVYHFPNLNIKDELCRIIEIAKETDKEHTKQIIGIINEIFLKMRQSIKAESVRSEFAKEMRDFLDLQITQKFKMEDLCNHMSKSESQTIRIFKEAYGVTPYAYLLGKRINFAKQLLQNTNLPIKQIAYDLKFADEYYFSNIFKEKVGISPSEFRKTRE